MLEGWYQALVAGAAADRQWPLLSALDEFRASFLDPHPHRSREPWAAYAGDQVVGAMLLEFPRKDNLHLAELEIDVPPQRRRQGVGAALWRAAEQRIREEGRRTVLSELNVPDGVADDEHPGWRFGTDRGFGSVNVEQRLVLDLGGYRPPVVPDGWRSGFELLTWVGAVPADRRTAFADLKTAMSQDVPVGEAEIEPEVSTAADIERTDERLDAQGWLPLRAVALRKADGRAVGYSEILVRRNGDQDALQEDTLVLREFRGSRLGAALKVANLESLQRNAPSVSRVQTWTAVQNGPMQHINAVFGFRPVERMHEFQLQLPSH